MKSELRIPIKNSIATRLLTIVFSLYLVIAIGVTLGHMFLEYRHQKDSIRQDLKYIQKTFERGLALDLWEMDQKSLYSTIEGMLDIPYIVGVKIINANNVDIAVGGIIAQRDTVGKVDQDVDLLGLKQKKFTSSGDKVGDFNIFMHRFPIIYTYENEIKQMGIATVYSSTSIVLRRVKLGFMLLIINAVLKTAALWLIFLWFSNILLRRPLSSLAADTKKITLDNLDSTRIKISTTGQNELSVIEQSFNSMIENLHQSIVEKEHAKKELNESAQRLAIHVEQTPLGVIEWDLDFRITQWNKAAENIFGYSKQEAIGQTGLELVVPIERHHRAQPIWDDLVTGKGGTRLKNDNKTKDGKTINCEWYNTSLLDSNGVVVGVASLVEDITEQKNMEKEKFILERQLQQSQKMEAIGALAGGVAHDFNNILGIILGYSDMLKIELSNNTALNEKVDQIIKAGNRAADLVRQILAFSRQNKKELVPIRPDLVIKESLKMLRSSIPSTIKIESSIPKTGSIVGDPTQFHQILMNLSTNANHAMRKTGGMLKFLLEPIKLEKIDAKAFSSALSPGSYLKLEISDTGHGMDKATQQKIFDPYYTTKKIGEGTGLGLSVVHGIVKNFGGHISVYSEPDKGTTFRIYLPHVVSEAKKTIDLSIDANPTGDEHILVVDDEKPIVELQKFMLEDLGYRVTTCTSSPDAFKIFQNQPKDISLVVTDMTMPDMTGIDLVKYIRAIQPEIPVILCSGFSELINEETAEYIDNLKYLKKPVLKNDFALNVRKLLDNDKKHM